MHLTPALHLYMAKVQLYTYSIYLLNYLLCFYVLMSWGPTEGQQTAYNKKVLHVQGFRQQSTKEIAGGMLYRCSSATSAAPHALI